MRNKLHRNVSQKSQERGFLFNFGLLFWFTLILSSVVLQLQFQHSVEELLTVPSFLACLFSRQVGVPWLQICGNTLTGKY